MSSTKVSVVVPIRNEDKHISNCLRSLLKQTYPSVSYEVIVVDGKSSDHSRQLVERLCGEHANLRCLENPWAIVPCGMNIGIRNAQGAVIIRADGHNIYPADYIENCVKYLEQTGADNVGGPWLTVPANKTFGARLVAAILTSPFGVGTSQFRTGSKEGYVETVPFGAFRRELFERVGMYNEKLVRNQDNELNARIRAAGGSIYQTPALRTEYHPVAEFWKLMKVTFKTSQWHLFTLMENSRSMGVRHLAPALLITGLGFLVLASLLNSFAIFLLVVLLLFYLVIGFCITAFRGTGYGLPMTCILPFACICFHMSYGLGTLAGVRYLLKSPSPHPIRDGQPIGCGRER